MLGTSTITIKGQITIPVDLRRQLDLIPGKRVGFVRDAEGIKVKPLVDFFKLKGSVRTNKPFNIKRMRQTAARSLAKRIYGKTA